MAPLPTKFHTPRLTLLRLTNTAPNHPHVQYFHANWSDASATAWSLHGATTSLEESREWMIEQLSQFDSIFYAVFERKEQGEKEEELSELVGSVSLRLQHAGPSLPPPPPPSTLPNPPRHQDEPTASTVTITPAPTNLNLRALGYAFLESARSRGYATEANRGLLDAYSASIPPQEKETTRFYIEAEVDEENPGSVRVLQKLGFGCVGWKDEEKVWLNGGWRAGHWVYGRDA